MHSLTIEQKVENYRELIKNNNEKISNLQINNQRLEEKIQKLLKRQSEQSTQERKLTGVDSLLGAANTIAR